MSKLRFREKVRTFKTGFNQGKEQQYIEANFIMNFLLIECSLIVGSYSLMIVFIILKMPLVSGVLMIAAFMILGNLISLKRLKKIMKITWTLNFKIVLLCGKYGNVINKKEWKKIKKEDPELYKELWQTKEYVGHCYYFSRALAMHLENAQLMYCAIMKDGKMVSHAVIIKNECVFDTNFRRHFDLLEYKTLFSMKEYNIFTKEEYGKENFFEKIRNDLVNYCEENDIYCNPQ